MSFYNDWKKTVTPTAPQVSITDHNVCLQEEVKTNTMTKLMGESLTSKVKNQFVLDKSQADARTFKTLFNCYYS